MASAPLYLYRGIALLQFPIMTPGEGLSDYRRFVNFDRIAEPTIRVVFTFVVLNGAPCGTLFFRVGGTSINTLDGTVVHSETVCTGGGGFPFQTVVFDTPKVWSGIVPFKISGNNSNGVSFPLSEVTLVLLGV